MIRILFDSTEINIAYVFDLSQIADPFGEYFTIGQTVCRQFNLTIKTSAYASIPSKVYLYEDNGSSTQANWSKYATLYVDTYENNDNGTTSFVLADEMVKFNKTLIYTTSNTLLQILTAVCTAHGITLNNQSFYMSDFSLSWQDDLTERDFISYIAEVNAGYAYIDADGNLSIASYSINAESSISLNDCGEYKIGEQHIIDRVYVELASATKYYPSTSVNETLYLNPDNIFFVDSGNYTIDGIIRHIYDSINGLTFNSIFINRCPITPIRACQTVSVGSYKFIARINYVYSRQWKGGYESKFGETRQKETSVETTKESVRRINIKVDREAGEIRQEVSDLDADVTARLLLKIDKSAQAVISTLEASATQITWNASNITINAPIMTFGTTKTVTLSSQENGMLFDGAGEIRFNTKDSFKIYNYNETTNKIVNVGIFDIGRAFITVDDVRYVVEESNRIRLGNRKNNAVIYGNELLLQTIFNPSGYRTEQYDKKNSININNYATNVGKILNSIDLENHSLSGYNRTISIYNNRDESVYNSLIMKVNSSTNTGEVRLSNVIGNYSAELILLANNYVSLGYINTSSVSQTSQLRLSIDGSWLWSYGELDIASTGSSDLHIRTNGGTIYINAGSSDVSMTGGHLYWNGSQKW